MVVITHYYGNLFYFMRFITCIATYSKTKLNWAMNGKINKIET